MSWSIATPLALKQTRLFVFAIAVGLGVAACSGGDGAAGGAIGPVTGALPHPHASGSSSSNPIQHIIVVVQENRSFDDLFATFPGADGATEGLMKTPSGGDTYVPLEPENLKTGCNPPHGYGGFLKDYDGGKMDGFGLGPTTCHGNTTFTYQYVNTSQVAPYWDIAQQYVLGDHMFQTQGSGSFTAHQDLIAGTSTINAAQTVTLVDVPTHTPWGCDAPKGTKTSLLKYVASEIKYEPGAGPYPCLTQYETMRDLLDAANVSWKYYSPAVVGNEGKLWNAFDAIKAVREGPEWTTNISTPETNIFNDISNGDLAAVSWVVPDRQNSDHPAGPGPDTGPSWVAQIVNAVGGSSYWPTTAIIVVWDDWGGFYDHVPPPFFDDWGGLGFRVPLLVVSPYAAETNPSQPGYISHTQYEFGSILKFIEQTFGLPSLGKTDARATSIVDCFDFTEQPRTFQEISAKYSKSYFLHQRPSNLPVDNE
jgi:phospholipase C